MTQYSIKPQPRHLAREPLTHGPCGGCGREVRNRFHPAGDGVNWHLECWYASERWASRVASTENEQARMRQAFYAALDEGKTPEQARDAALGVSL